MNFKCCHFYVLHHHLFSHITKLYRSCGTNQCQGHRSDDSSQVAFLELCHTVILITMAIDSNVVCTCLHLTFLLSSDSISLQCRMSFSLDTLPVVFIFDPTKGMKSTLMQRQFLVSDLCLNLLSWAVVQFIELDIGEFQNWLALWFSRYTWILSWF